MLDALGRDGACAPRGRQDLAERARRTEATLATLRAKPFSWATRGNCIHLWRAHLIGMGYSIPPVPRFTTPLGAKRALYATGHKTLDGLVTQYLARIPASRLIVGDVVMLPGEGPFGALGIFDGGIRVMTWHGRDDSQMRAVSVTAGEIVAAWAVELRA